MQALNQANGEPVAVTPLAEPSSPQLDPTIPPTWLQFSHISYLLDVREAQATAQNPLALITPATLALADDQLLLLRSSFEPVPLYQWLARRGYQAWAHQHTNDDWLVLIGRLATTETQPTLCLELGVALQANPGPRNGSTAELSTACGDAG